MNSEESPGPVVVGIDGSDAAIGAAEWAAREAVHHDVPLRLVHVIQFPDGPVGFADNSSAEDDVAESFLRAALLAVEATDLLVKIDTAVLYGDVDSALIAESSGATLICAGSVGIGRVANMLLGSTAAILAQEAHCPAAVIRHGDESPRPEAGLIAVVIDDGPRDGEVVRCAMEEARMRQAPVLALCVGRKALFERSRDKFYRRLDGVLRRFPDVEVEVATTRLGVTRYLQERIGAVQLIVIGSDDAGRVTQLVGPRGLPILRHADCSVLVARGTHHPAGAFQRRALICQPEPDRHAPDLAIRRNANPHSVTDADPERHSSRAHSVEVARPLERLVMDTMNAWALTEAGPIDTNPLSYQRKPIPRPGAGELLVRVNACGVCRTDLHVSEGDLAPHRAHVTPGHEIVSTVVELGAEVSGHSVGDKVGVAWLRQTCGTCRYCRRGAENLCPYSQYTGWDHDGGYAEYCTVPAAFAYRLPGGYDDVELAPLLCAGIIGYRALKRVSLPQGGRLGIYGFGGSAHLTAQVALAQGATVHVMTRGAQAQQLALELGAASAAGAYDAPPEPLDGAILFAPVGDLVPVALRALDRGGILSIAGIHLSDVPPLNYEREMFYEREIRSVTANTRADGEAFLRFAADHHLRVSTHEYPLAHAQQALKDLKAGRFDGAAVLTT